jgi:hypothetical protein
MLWHASYYECQNFILFLQRMFSTHATWLAIIWFLFNVFMVNYGIKLFSLNSSVVDNNHDRYKTANIEINLLFFQRLIKYLIFRTSSYL